MITNERGVNIARFPFREEKHWKQFCFEFDIFYKVKNLDEAELK